MYERCCHETGAFANVYNKNYSSMASSAFWKSWLVSKHPQASHVVTFMPFFHNADRLWGNKMVDIKLGQFTGVQLQWSDYNIRYWDAEEVFEMTSLHMTAGHKMIDVVSLYSNEYPK